MRNIKNYTSRATRFKWQHLHFWVPPSEKCSDLISFQVLCFQGYQILFSFIFWDLDVSWAGTISFIPQLEINLIKIFWLSLANIDYFWHIFSNLVVFKWRLESQLKRLELRLPYFSFINVEYYLWMGKKEKLKSEELCYHHTPAEAEALQIWGS